MADLSDILGQLGTSSDLTTLKNQLTELNELKNELMKAGRTRAYSEIIKLEKAVKDLNKATEEELKLQKELSQVQSDNSEEQEKILKRIRKNQQDLERSQAVIKRGYDAQRASIDESRRSVEKFNDEILKTFSSTRAGKAIDALTGSTARFAAGITVAGLAVKAFNRFAAASDLRTQIIIRNFRGLEKISDDAADSVKGVGTAGEKSLGQLAAGAVRAAAATARFEAELRKTNMTAYRMGVDAGEVSNAMLRFSRIAGVDSPESLGVLTRGAIAVSKSMNIDMSEAIDFVGLRMEKFGGTSQSAILALDDLRNETENINKEFGRTVIRTDDIVKSMIEMSRESSIYAIDQRLVGTILRDNIVRLQTMGESYDAAYRKAEAYTKAVAGQKAPEWMQTLSGIDIVGQLQGALPATFKEIGGKIPDAFMSQFGNALDRAKPGLARRVADIVAELNAGTMTQYDAARLIQEITAGTEVGVAAMNKHISHLSKYSHNVALIAAQFGVTFDEAKSMIQSAQAEEKLRARISKLVSLTADGLAKELSISEAHAKLLSGNKDAIREYMTYEERAKKAQEEKVHLAQIEEETAAKRKNLASNIKDIDTRITELKGKQTKESAREIAILEQQKQAALVEWRQTEDRRLSQYYQNRVKELQSNIERVKTLMTLPAEVGENKDKLLEQQKKFQAELDRVQTEAAERDVEVVGRTEDLEKQFMQSSIQTGRIIKEAIEYLSSPLVLGSIALGLGALKAVGFVTNIRLLNILKTLQLALAKGALGVGSGGPGTAGGGTAGGGGTWGGGGKKETYKTKAPTSKIITSAGKVGETVKPPTGLKALPSKLKKLPSLLKGKRGIGSLLTIAAVVGGSMLFSGSAQAQENEETERDIDGLKDNYDRQAEESKAASDNIKSAADKFRKTGDRPRPSVAEAVKDSTDKLKGEELVYSTEELNAQAEQTSDQVGGLLDNVVNIGTSVLSLGSLTSGLFSKPVKPDVQIEPISLKPEKMSLFAKLKDKFAKMSAAAPETAKTATTPQTVRVSAPLPDKIVGGQRELKALATIGEDIPVKPLGTMAKVAKGTQGAKAAAKGLSVLNMAKGAGKSVLNVAKKSKGILGKIPYLSTAINGLMLAAAAGPDIMAGNYKEAAIKSIPLIASTIGGAVGSVGGGALGTLALPGVGTAVGGIAGGAAGSAVGDTIGNKIVSWIRGSSRETAEALSDKIKVEEAKPGAPMAMAVQQQRAQQVAATDQTAMTQEDMMGMFEGPLPDGSVVLKIPNFMNTMAKGMVKARQAGKPK